MNEVKNKLIHSYTFIYRFRDTIIAEFISNKDIIHVKKHYLTDMSLFSQRKYAIKYINK